MWYHIIPHDSCRLYWNKKKLWTLLLITQQNRYGWVTVKFKLWRLYWNQNKLWTLLLITQQNRYWLCIVNCKCISVCGRWWSLFKISKGGDMNIWNYILYWNLKNNNNKLYDRQIGRMEFKSINNYNKYNM